MTFETESLRTLVAELEQKGYYFLCPTPESHASLIQSLENGQSTRAKTIHDIFGWSLPVDKNSIKDIIPNIDTRIFNTNGETLKPKLRVSSINYLGMPLNRLSGSLNLYLHSAYPCKGFAEEGVFFGPDTYRYMAFLGSQSTRALLNSAKNKRMAIDVCCGGGAGAIAVSRIYEYDRVMGLDLNAEAVKLAKINQGSQKQQIDFRKSNLFSALSEDERKIVDLVVCDPPFIPTSKTTNLYCDGGSDGIEFSIRVIEESLKVLSGGGLFAMYTAVCIMRDQPDKDVLLDALMKMKSNAEILYYSVLDNDIFGNEVDERGIGFIQAVGLVLRKVG